MERLGALVYHNHLVLWFAHGVDKNQDGCGIPTLHPAPVPAQNPESGPRRGPESTIQKAESRITAPRGGQTEYYLRAGKDYM